MQLVYQFNIKENKIINDWCIASNNLYNQALYIIKKELNDNSKDSIGLGKKINQKFVNIPHFKLINYLKYKCELVGVNFIETEESYTSKCDHLAFEEMKHQENYLGKRIKRGLFQSSTGRLLNADVNGALGILRKVVDDSVLKHIINSGLLFNPVKIRNVFSTSLQNFNKNLLLT